MGTSNISIRDTKWTTHYVPFESSSKILQQLKMGNTFYLTDAEWNRFKSCGKDLVVMIKVKEEINENPISGERHIDYKLKITNDGRRMIIAKWLPEFNHKKS